MRYGGFHENMEGNPHGWRVYVRENPTQKWMMTRGTPISGNPPYHILYIYIYNTPKHGDASYDLKS